ncbi:MAG: hypothetical protein EBQ75_00590, partial [Actinobacteria bacterium]|nr:hypothetical protein [Actinomycetota bacterium]
MFWLVDEVAIEVLGVDVGNDGVGVQSSPPAISTQPLAHDAKRCASRRNSCESERHFDARRARVRPAVRQDHQSGTTPRDPPRRTRCTTASPETDT